MPNYNKKSNDQRMEKWRIDETFLPRPLRGPDNQTAISKAYLKHKREFPITLIDHLWFLAKQGYVLRAATKSADYIDIQETIAQAKKDGPQTVDDLLEQLDKKSVFNSVDTSMLF